MLIEANLVRRSLEQQGFTTFSTVSMCTLDVIHIFPNQCAAERRKKCTKMQIVADQLERMCNNITLLHFYVSIKGQIIDKSTVKFVT
jgi:hypothetical protein